MSCPRTPFRPGRTAASCGMGPGRAGRVGGQLERSTGSRIRHPQTAQKLRKGCLHHRPGYAPPHTRDVRRRGQPIAEPAQAAMQHDPLLHEKCFVPLVPCRGHAGRQRQPHPGLKTDHSFGKQPQTTMAQTSCSVRDVQVAVRQADETTEVRDMGPFFDLMTHWAPKIGQSELVLASRSIPTEGSVVPNRAHGSDGQVAAKAVAAIALTRVRYDHGKAEIDVHFHLLGAGRRFRDERDGDSGEDVSLEDRSGDLALGPSRKIQILGVEPVCVGDSFKGWSRSRLFSTQNCRTGSRVRNSTSRDGRPDRLPPGPEGLVPAPRSDPAGR